MCSPTWFHQRHGSDETYDLSVYRNDGGKNHFFAILKGLISLLDAYFRALSIAYRQEIRELYALGCRMWWRHAWNMCTDPLAGHIQIDDPTFCYFCDERMITGMKKSGVDHEALLETYIRAINLITLGRPKNLTISIHMCRGNYKVCSEMYPDFDGLVYHGTRFEGRRTLLRRWL